MRCDAKRVLEVSRKFGWSGCCGAGRQILLKMSVQTPPARRIKRISQELLKPFGLAAILGERRKLLWMLLAAAAVGSPACRKEAEVHAPEVRPVRTVSVTRQPAGETVVLTGHIEAENEAALGFRISGRMIERSVNVGDRVKPGQVLARLDPQDERNGLRSAEPNLSAAQGQLTQARNNFERQRRLQQRGVISRAEFDSAQEALQTAQARVDDAEAQVKLASDRLGFTELKADAAGSVTPEARNPEKSCRRVK
jgi:membrane fusion protein, multidrug efflux system